MSKEKKEERNLSLEEARELLSEAWLTFWSGTRTPHESEIRNIRIRGILEKLSSPDKEYFLHAEKDKDSELAKIREAAKAFARTGKKDAPSAGERLHIRRQKAAKRGTSPKRIR